MHCFVFCGKLILTALVCIHSDRILHCLFLAAYLAFSTRLNLNFPSFPLSDFLPLVPLSVFPSLFPFLLPSLPPLSSSYLTVNVPLPRHALQLVGVTALWMAAKIEEIYPPRASDFVLTTDNAYSVADMIRTELQMLEGLRWNMVCRGGLVFGDALVTVAVWGTMLFSP